MREFFERWTGANLDRSKNKKYRVKDSNSEHNRML